VNDDGGRAGSVRALVTERLPSVVWAISLTIAGVYLIVFVSQLPRNITELLWNADYSSGFTLPETLAQTGNGGRVAMGAAAEWVPLWFGLLTARMPLHRVVWEALPTFLFVATALMVGWSVLKLEGRRAALLAVLIGLVASPLALSFLMAPVAHNLVYPCTALLGVYLVWLARADGRRRATAWIVPPSLGVVFGTCLASDQLLVVTAAVPLAIASMLAAIQRDRRCRLVALSGFVTLAVAIPIAAVTSSLMTSAGYVKVASPAKVAPVSELAEHARYLADGLKTLFNGYLGPRHPGVLHAPLGIACDVVMFAALLTMVVFAARVAARLLAAARRAGAAQAPPRLARSLHVVYWVTSAAATCGAFWIAAETAGGTVLHEAYYGTAIFSVAAVIPLLLSCGALARLLISTGAGVFFAGSLAGLTSNYLDVAVRVERAAPAIVRFAQANRVTFGYGGYGEASSVTWNTHGRVTIRPVMQCDSPASVGICAFYLVAPPSWYVPRRRRTFLLVDRDEPWVTSAPRGLGRPLATYSVGAISMYVYPYDIASRVGPPPY
jgi:hypothetical protein